MATAMTTRASVGFTVLTKSSGVSGVLNCGFSNRRSGNVVCGLCRAAQGEGGQALLWIEAVRRDAPGITIGFLGSLREKSMFSILNYLEDYSLGREGEKFEGITAGIIAAAVVLFFALAAPPSHAEPEVSEFKPYYGTAASASSYGGYGGNSNKESTAEYTFDVPREWKEKVITKIEKGTNGTDAEFDNPRHKEEKVYVTYLSNFRKLAPIDRVLENLALSDPVLQDIIAYAEGNIKATDRQDSNGQQYYDYEIDSPVANVLVSVTCAKNKLYAHFVKAGPSDWARDQTMLRRLHESFQTVGKAPLGL